MRAAALTNKLAGANAKIEGGLQEGAPRPHARASGARNSTSSRPQVFFATLDGYELEVSELQGQVAGPRAAQLATPASDEEACAPRRIFGR